MPPISPTENAHLKTHLLASKLPGRLRAHSLRDIFDVLRSGCPWRLPALVYRLLPLPKVPYERALAPHFRDPPRLKGRVSARTPILPRLLWIPRASRPLPRLTALGLRHARRRAGPGREGGSSRSCRSGGLWSGRLDGCAGIGDRARTTSGRSRPARRSSK